MTAAGPDKKELRHEGFYADALSRDSDRGNDPELPATDLELKRESQPAWIFKSLGARMESVSVSLLSWMVVGVLTAWFVIWLAETLSRLSSRIP